MQVSYLNVGGPGNVPPTAQQATRVSTVNVGLNPVNSGDTSQSITHMWGLPNAFISQGWPEVWFEGLDTLAQGSNWYCLSKAPNFAIVGRGANTASLDTTNNQQVICRIDRIWSGAK
jgi:hypothetical protein